jgi:outer membrane protein OmpA-like peptidoglycan-associated protein
MGAGKEPEPKSGESFWAGLWKSATNTLGPALVSLVVSVGFVAFAGKAVLWARFSALDVPADQVVKAVPQDEAVAVGASFLLLFGLAGLLAALGVYLIDRSGRATPGMSRGLLAILAVEVLVAIWFGGDISVESRMIASEVALLALAVIFWSTFVYDLINRRPGVRGPRGDRMKAERKVRAFYQEPLDGDPTSGITRRGAKRAVGAAAALGGAAFLIALASGAAPELATIVAIPVIALGLVGAVLRHVRRFDRKGAEDARRAAIAAEKQRDEEEREKRAREEREQAEERLRREAELRAELARKSGSPRWSEQGAEFAGPLLPPETQADADAAARPPRPEFTVRGLVLAIPLTVVIVAAPSLILWEWWLAVSLGTVAILGIGLWRISTFGVRRFVWYGLAVFISVPLFGTVMLMARNAEDPQVQPMALIRNTDGPDEAIQGLYVTETSDRVYFANVATEGCTKTIRSQSGRLLWVPNDEVVAISIGPAQDVKDAAGSALEMSYALTPSVETPAAGAISLTTREERSKKLKEAEEAREAKEAEERAPQLNQRLEDPGAAVRPNFGRGLGLVPEIAPPGEVVELRMSVVNQSVNGFGARPNGRSLRLNGAPLAVLREWTRYADQAEYVKTEGNQVLSLDKKGVYGLKKGRPHVLSHEENQKYSGRRFVKLDEDSVFAVDGSGGLEGSARYLQVRGDGTASRLDGEPMVRLEDGDEVRLKPGLLRQAWENDAIRFRVPDDASSGVVTVECEQLAGQPLLRVVHSPTARIGVQMRPGSTGVTLDSSRSGDEDKGDRKRLTRRWEVDGLKKGHRKTTTVHLPPRRGAYSVKLTVTDRAGNSDTAKLRLLRLPSSMFAFDGRKPLHPKAVRKARKAVEKTVEAEKPVQVELDGHADNPGTPAYNLGLSLKRDDNVREQLLQEPEEPQGAPAVPVRELAYGESCPIDERPGRRPRNRRVDLFLLNQGVTVKPPEGCRPGRLKSTRWHLPSPKEGEGGSEDEPGNGANGLASP